MDSWHRRWVGVRVETAPRQENPRGELGMGQTFTSEAEDSKEQTE